jgi:hypothetical protein
MKLEATWILTNIGYADEAEILLLFDDRYSIINHLNQILQGNDIQMIDQVIWLVANSAGTSLTLKERVLARFDIINGLSRVIFEAIQSKAQVKSTFLGNIIWCIVNLLRLSKIPGTARIDPAGVLTTEEMTKLIFVVDVLMAEE